MVGISNSRSRAVASLNLRIVPLQTQWRRPRSSMPSSDRMQSMSRWWKTARTRSHRRRQHASNCGVREGSALGQAEVDPAGERGQRREGKGAGRGGGGGENRKGRQCAEHAEFPTPMSPAQWAVRLQNALDGDVKESPNQWLEHFGVQAHQSLPQQQPVQMQAELLLHHSPTRSPQSGTTVAVEEAVHGVETISTGSAGEDDTGRLFRLESRFQPYQDGSEAWKC